MNSKTFYSHGKLLISAEYVVLDGAVALAIPTQFGQSLLVEPIAGSKLIWQSFDEKSLLWFENEFSVLNIDSAITKATDEISLRLLQILKAAKQLNPSFLSSNQGYKITTYLNFKREWGLGTSSTLINNIAQWCNIDAYKLLHMTFGGSGYDIACAQRNKPISYQLNDGAPLVKEVNFFPTFKDHLYFVYLNKKQNSREGISQYKLNKPPNLDVDTISDISHKLISCKSLSEFERLITLHEEIISRLIQKKTIKALFFKDFKGCIKSLGAWGGDFILATSQENPSVYFKNKGFEMIIPYNEMVLEF